MISSFDPLPILAARDKNLPGYSYKLADGYGLDMTFTDQLDIDEKKMAVWISYADGNRRDGVGDLLVVEGIDESRHRKNPIHLFDHGKSVTLPVGKVEDPETGRYCGIIDPVTKCAKDLVYYYQGTGLPGIDKASEYDHALFCQQVFHLLAQKFIRGGSIGYQVLQARELPPEPMYGTPKGLLLISVLKLESSTVVMPANADTVRKGLAPDLREVLSMPYVCGKPLSPMLVKSLTPFASEKKAQLGYEGKAREEVFQHAGHRFVIREVPKPFGGGETVWAVFVPNDPRGGADSMWPSIEAAKQHIREGWSEEKKGFPSDDIDPDKARQILRDGEVNGKPLSDKQRGMFGAAAGEDKSLSPDTIREINQFVDSLKTVPQAKLTEALVQAGVPVINHEIGRNAQLNQLRNALLSNPHGNRYSVNRKAAPPAGPNDATVHTRQPYVQAQDASQIPKMGVRQKPDGYYVYDPTTGKDQFGPFFSEGIALRWAERLNMGKKNVKELRKKYRRTAKGLVRRLKRSSPGSSVIYLAGKDLERARKEAEAKGIKFQHISSRNGTARVKLIGDDGAIDEVAKSYGRLVKFQGAKSMKAQPLREPSRTNVHAGTEEAGETVVARRAIMQTNNVYEYFAQPGERLTVVGRNDVGQMRVRNRAGMEQSVTSIDVRRKAMGTKAKRPKYGEGNPLVGYMQNMGSIETWRIQATLIKPDGTSKEHTNGGFASEREAEEFANRMMRGANARSVYGAGPGMSTWTNVRVEPEKSMPIKRTKNNPLTLIVVGDKVEVIPGSGGHTQEYAGQVGTVTEVRGDAVKVRLPSETRSVTFEKNEVKKKALKDTKSMKNTKKKDGEDLPVGDESTTASGEERQLPLGAQVLRRLHEDASLLLQDYDEMLGPLENENVKTRLQGKLEGFTEELTELEEEFGKLYPDLGGLVGTKDDDALEDAADLESDGEPDNDKEEYEEELEPTPKDMDTMDDNAVGSSSEEREEVSPEDALEGMETVEEEEEGEKSLRRKVKSLRRKYGKAMTFDDVGIGETFSFLDPQVAPQGKKGPWKKVSVREYVDANSGERHELGYTRTEVEKKSIGGRRKGFCPECGKEDCVCETDEKGIKVAPALVAAVAPAVGQLAGQLLTPKDKGYVKEAGGFLGEIGQPDSILDDEGRMKSYHYHKTLSGMAQLDEAREDLEEGSEDLQDSGIPPAEFEPGAGAKGVGSAAAAVAKHPRVRAAARGAVRGAIEGATTGKAADERQRSDTDSEGAVRGERNEITRHVANPAPDPKPGQSTTMNYKGQMEILGQAADFLKELAFLPELDDDYRGRSTGFSKGLNDFIGPDEEAPVEDPNEELPPDEGAPEGAPSGAPEGVVMEEEEEPGMEMKFLADEADLQNKKIAELSRMLSRLPI